MAFSCYIPVVFHMLWLAWIIPFTAMNEVAEFGFGTSSENWAAANAVVEVTLWFNFTIYQFSAYPGSASTWYTAKKTESPTFTVLGSSDCHKKSNAISDTQIMLEYHSTDAFDMGHAKVITESGAWYGDASTIPRMH
eukprot:1017426_1